MGRYVLEGALCLVVGGRHDWLPSNQHPHAEACWNVKEKRKYQPKNLIHFHLQGCSCVLKRSLTLPMSKDTNCNDKRVENLPPSVRS